MGVKALTRTFSVTVCLFAMLVTNPVHGSDGQWHGAAFEADAAALQLLAEAGADSVRVYHHSDHWVFDAAHRLGLKVVMGLWVPHRRHGATLQDPQTIREISRELLTYVEKYKDHPALLAWSIGNEVETGETDPRFAWQVVDRIAADVKAVDPDHPTLMVVADTGMQEYRWLADCCKHIDMLGLNIYAGAVFDLPDRLRKAGITKPVVITELGPLGQWQAGKKPWGTPVELTSRQKAEFYRNAIPFLKQQSQIKGVFAFLWGAKQEQTKTWHGLLLEDGSGTEMTDALATVWGRPPKQPAPTIRGIGISADTFKPGEIVSVGVDSLSYTATPLQADWQLYEEATDLRKGGDTETQPGLVKVSFQQSDATGAKFAAPRQPGAYRLFVTLRDSSGKAATANLPLLVVAAENARP